MKPLQNTFPYGKHTVNFIMRQKVPDQHRQFAKDMRADSTRAENMLWQALRAKKLAGLKFKRQVPIDGYILDFVCFDKKLIIEVDGGQHSGNENDLKRDAHFEALGFHIVRFWNHEVERNLDGVCQHILAVCNGRA